MQHLAKFAETDSRPFGALLNGLSIDSHLCARLFSSPFRFLNKIFFDDRIWDYIDFFGIFPNFEALQFANGYAEICFVC